MEQALEALENGLAVRPIFHKTEPRIEAHIFVAFLAYCLQVTLEARLRELAGGTTPREGLGSFERMQMVDVRLRATGGRELILSRDTEPEAEQRMRLEPLRRQLPGQPPPRITARRVTAPMASGTTTSCRSTSAR